MSQQFKTVDMLRLEVEADPTGLVNLVQNPNGELGGWGWVTPVPGSVIDGSNAYGTGSGAGGDFALKFTQGPASAGGQYFYTEALPVSAGQYVAATYYYRDGSAQAGHRARFDWLDANQVDLGVPSAWMTVAPAEVNWAQQQLPPVQAPAGASYARLRIEISSSTGTYPLTQALGYNMYFNRVTVAKAATSGELGTVRTNLVTNPSFEVGTTGWAAYQPVGGSSISRVTTDYWTGTAALQVSQTGASGSATAAYTATGLTVGQTYTVSAYVKSSAAGAKFYFIAQGSAASPDIAVSSSWGRASFTFTAAATSHTLILGFKTTAPAGTAYSGLIDAVMLEQASSAGSYFDGSTAAAGGWTYAWAGTAHASASTATSSNLAYVESVQYLNVLGQSHEIRVVREALSVGTLEAEVLSSTLDPAQSTVIRPGRRCRLTALKGGSWEPLFTGKIAGAEVKYELKDPEVPESRRARITLSAVDNAATLANQRRPEGVATIAELPYVLEGCGVPWSVNGSGNQAPFATVVARNENASALDQVAITRDTNAPAYAYVSRNGVLTVYTPDPFDSPWLLPESVYTDLDVSYSTQDLINEVTVKFLRMNPVTGDTEEVPYGPYRDEASISEWGVRSAEFTVQGLSEETSDIPDLAAAVLAANGTPQVRVNSATFPVSSTSMIVSERALLELYDPVNVPNSRLAAASDCVVTGIEHSITPDKWMVKLVFSGPGSVAAPTFVPSPETGAGGKTVGQLLRPAGEVTMYAGATEVVSGSALQPVGNPGWLVCNGASVLVASYPDLFAAIGYTHGGSGASFNVPDLVDKFPIGAGTKALGTSGGDPTKPVPPHTHADTLAVSSSGAHQHNIAGQSGGGTVTGGTASGTAPTNASYSGHAHGGATNNGVNDGAHTHNMTGSVGAASGSAFDVMNPWRALNFIIRAV